MWWMPQIGKKISSIGRAIGSHDTLCELKPGRDDGRLFASHWNVPLLCGRLVQINTQPLLCAAPLCDDDDLTRKRRLHFSVQ